MQSLPKFLIPKGTVQNVEDNQEQNTNTEDEQEQPKELDEEIPINMDDDLDGEIDEIILIPQRISRQIMAHHEVLEEIPEAEVEYEQQRDRRDEGLEEIMEEEEGDIEEEEEMEIIEGEEVVEGEEVGGEDVMGDEDFWGDREEDHVPRRASYPADNDDELEEWEWTQNGRNGMQYRYSR